MAHIRHDGKEILIPAYETTQFTFKLPIFYTISIRKRQQIVRFLFLPAPGKPTSFRFETVKRASEKAFSISKTPRTLNGQCCHLHDCFVLLNRHTFRTGPRIVRCSVKMYVLSSSSPNDISRQSIIIRSLVRTATRRTSPEKIRV